MNKIQEIYGGHSSLNKVFKMIPNYVVVLMALFAWSSCSMPPPEQKRPNILFISLDDLNDWTGFMGGHPQASTPYLDAFAEESMTFMNNYCTSPGCNPSRSTLMTGLHTYTSGMYSNYQDWRKVPKMAKAKTIGHYLRDQGYYSTGAGKIFHYAQVDTNCWDAYYPSQKNNMPADFLPPDRPVNMKSFKYMYGMFDWAPLEVDEAVLGDVKTVNYVIEQLQTEHDRPFFLAAGIYRPHVPWYVPVEYYDRFPLDSVELPAVIPNDLEDLGDRAREMIRRGGNYHKHVAEADLWKEAVQGYLASIAFADDMVGRLLDALKNSAYADNTIVMIWSDHGWQLGEKQHWRKFALWENLIRTVLMIQVPSDCSPALNEGTDQGARSSSLTSLLDLYPTIVELCGVPKPGHLDGQSLVPLMRDPLHHIDRAIISTYDFGDYSVRQGKWHYIKYIDDSEELYDLSQDPNEWYNLGNQPAFDSIKALLGASLPTDPEPLVEASLITLMEHHIPPIKSREFYFSQERKDWLKRFEAVE